MNILGTLKTFLCLSVVFVAWSSKASVGTRIVGGVEEDINKHSYIISLQHGSSHSCGGSLIAKKFVLTAGHCVDYSRPSSLKVVIGSQGADQKQVDAEVHSVSAIHVHPDYVSGWTKISYDYAILELENETEFEPILMAPNGVNAIETSVDGYSTVLGWGALYEGGRVATTLMKVDVPLVSDEACRAAYPNSIDQSMFCAGYKEGGKDSCQGDSGGPLIVTNSEGERVLAGIVSWGEGCARAEKFGVYSQVSTARGWIDEVLVQEPEDSND
jgi:trypsin